MYYNKNSFSNYYDEAIEDLRLKIMAESDDYVIGTDMDELASYYYRLKALVPNNIDAERTETIEPAKEVKIVPTHRREAFYQQDGDLPYEYEWLKLTLPIIPHKNITQLLQLRPDGIGLGGLPKDLKWKRDYVEYIVEIKGYGYDHDEGTVLRRVNEKQQSIKNYIHLIAANIESGNSLLDAEIKSFLRIRKEKLNADKSKYDSLFKQINIPVKRKEDDVARRIQVDTRPVVQNVRPTPRQPENYVIDRNIVMDIISIMNNQGRQFEKTPATFVNSGEEDFRNILLVNLNTVFEGKATGETFHTNGKTDIHLNIAKGDILICECKIWAGQALYLDTIDQLQSYLSWRENYGIVITFIRGTKPSTVLSAAETAIPNHQTYIRGFRKIDETHYISIHNLPTDDQKFVEIHHLFYNV